MPIYEYKCQNCDYQFEQLQKVNDKPLKICPQCHKSKLQKLVSSTGFALKGTGWYVTDFRDNKSEQPAKTEAPKPKTETKAEIKNE